MEEKKKKFYEQKWFMWVTVVVFAPVGILCLWKYKHYKTVPAVIFSLIFGLLFISFFSTNDEKTVTNNITKQDAASAKSMPNPTEISKPTRIPEPTEITKPTEIPTPTQTPKPTGIPKPTKPTKTPEPDVPREYKSALNKAYTYAKSMKMSKKAIYDQLVSEYGEKFSQEAAQYAIDNISYDWNDNALAKAISYQNKMNMSPSGIHDQLTSEYGEKFTKEQADYAIQHLNDN